jgi:hypothetical protein
VSNLILCLDADRNLGEGELPPSTAVIRYRRRVDPGEVLAIVEARRRPE